MKPYFYTQDYGAVADGRTVNTAAFQQAIDACHEAGGGIVVCEPGDYVIGSINLRSNVELFLSPGSKLYGSTELGDYADFEAEGFKHQRAPEGTVKYLIGASGAENVAISGSGEVYGFGPWFFDTANLKENGRFAQKPDERPRLLMLHKCRNVRIEDASFVDAPCWTFWLMLCERVGIRRISICGDERLLNNDGIDVDGCRDVTISDCMMRTEDDCIVIRAMQHVHETPAVCENVVVTNCVLESACQCIRVSCPSDYVTRNCVFNNLTLQSTNNGINFDFPARYLEDGKALAEVTNFSFTNILIDCTRHPLRIEVMEGIRIPRIEGIRFSDMRITSGLPCVLRGNSDTVIRDVTFSNVGINTTGDDGIITAFCEGITLNGVKVDNFPERKTSQE